MNKRFFVPLLIAALCQSFETQAMEPDGVGEGGKAYHLPSVAAPPIPGASTALVLQDGGKRWAFAAPLVRPSTVDTGKARTSLGDLAARLRGIGDSARTTSESIDTECVRLDAEYTALTKPAAPAPTSTVVVPHGFMGFSPDWAAGASFLPKDGTDQFDHRQWVLNLSSSNSGSGYLGLEGHANTTLANNLYLNGRHCAHPTSAIQGNSWCCGNYGISARYELLALVAFASRHSRTHRAYVSEFERFERQINTFDTQVRSYATAHGYAVPPPVAYITQRPVDRYRHIHGPAQTFSDWLKWLSPASNTSAEILGFTDIDDPGVMSQKVFVQNRYAPCGHNAAGNSYTAGSYCCNHAHAYSMKVDMFQVALDFLINQRYHEEYVRQATVFEDFARRTISSYWTGWMGVPTPLVLAGGSVVATSHGALVTTTAAAAATESSSSYQSLKSNRDQIRGHLTRTVDVLKLAAECTEISRGVLGAEELCREVDAFNAVAGRAGLEMDVMNAQLGAFQRQIEELTKNNESLATTCMQLQEEKRTREITATSEDWKRREKALQDQLDATQTAMQAQTEAARKRETEWQTAMEAAASARAEEERRVGVTTALAETLGEILFELNMAENHSDRYAFGTVTDEGLKPFALGRLNMEVKGRLLDKVRRLMAAKKSN